MRWFNYVIRFVKRNCAVARSIFNEKFHIFSTIKLYNTMKIHIKLNLDLRNKHTFAKTWLYVYISGMHPSQNSVQTAAVRGCVVHIICETRLFVTQQTRERWTRQHNLEYLIRLNAAFAKNIAKLPSDDQQLQHFHSYETEKNHTRVAAMDTQSLSKFPIAVVT